MPDVFVRGSTTKVSLRDKDQVGSPGGQGTVYRKGDVAYKVYHDRANMIPVSKIDELAVLTDPRIIRPQQVLMDNKNHPIGYTMKFLDDTTVLSAFFANTFKKDNAITTDMLVHLMQRMQMLIQHIHDHSILIVDLNELNWLVDHEFKEVFGIDTDSYQTAKFSCTMIMPNIRDRHAKEWSQETDWFSAGILWFNLFMGLHPYKAIHPKYPLPITAEKLDQRMMDNVSAFHKECRLPAICPSLNIIPQNYRDWMKAIFADGKRLPPPSALVAAVVLYTPSIKRIVGSDRFIIQEIMSVPEQIVQFYCEDSVRAVLTTKGIYVGGSHKCDVHGPTVLAHTPRGLKVIAAGIRNGSVVLHNVSENRPVAAVINGEQIMSYGGRLYVKNHESLLEIEFIEVGGNIITGVATVGNCLPNATKFYDGVVVQTLKDKTIVTMFPNSKEARQIILTELQGKGRVVAAKYDSNVLMVVVVNAKGQQDRYTFRFSRDYSEYDVRVVPDIQFTGLNFAVLDTGVCCNMNEAEEIELFHNARNSIAMKVIDDSQVRGDILIFSEGAGIVVAKGDTLYTMKLKP